LSVVVFISFKNDDEDVVEIDVRDTGFEHDVAICDRYFELVECIIDRDTNENWSQSMRQEFKSEVKKIQEEWKQLSKEDLTKKCTEVFENFEKGLREGNLNSFGCFTGVN
jgi:hypothetical protein